MCPLVLPLRGYRSRRCDSTASLSQLTGSFAIPPLPGGPKWFELRPSCQFRTPSFPRLVWPEISRGASLLSDEMKYLGQTGNRSKFTSPRAVNSIPATRPCERLDAESLSRVSVNLHEFATEIPSARNYRLIDARMNFYKFYIYARRKKYLRK